MRQTPAQLMKGRMVKRAMMSVCMAAVLLLGVGAGHVWAVDYSTGAGYVGGGYEEIQVLKGDIETIPTDGLKRVSITDPLIADINDARAKAVEVIGIAPGQTILFIWEARGKRTVVIRVVTEGMDLVKKRLQSLLKSADIKNI
jgi:hypothetical protein